jgi:uncharacterized protein YbjT (DUF2867 family)
LSIDGSILITGATGAQGGAVVDALVDAGADVRALVRNPDSPAASRLADRGVNLVLGDFDDPASLAEATRGAHGVFSVQMPPMPDDLDSEIRTGKALVDAALSAGVDTFVHTSVARAGDHENFTGWAEQRWWPAYWTSKAAVNDAVRAAGFPHWVVLKPAFMMENFIPPKSGLMFPSLSAGHLHTALADDTRLDLIAAADVGRFAAAAFADPGRFHGQDIDLAADALTMAEVAEYIAAAAKVPVTAKALSAADAIAAGVFPGVVQSQEWANVEGYKVDLDVAGSHGITLERFANWAQRHASALEVSLS